MERMRTNESFLKPGSPLDKAYYKNFKGLAYFPVDHDYVVAAQIEHIEHGGVVKMPTSDMLEKEYYRWAYLHFKLKGRDYRLTAFKYFDPFGRMPGSQKLLFIPFTDETNGKETYAVGRYIEIESPAENAKQMELDFNTCFNPYCAYGSGWSCPVPPKENHLDTRIEAGVKDFKKPKL